MEEFKDNNMVKIPEFIQVSRKEGDTSVIITFSKGVGDDKESYSFYLTPDSILRIQDALKHFSESKSTTLRKDIH